MENLFIRFKYYTIITTIDLIISHVTVIACRYHNTSLRIFFKLFKERDESVVECLLLNGTSALQFSVEYKTDDVSRYVHYLFTRSTQRINFHS